VRREVLLRLEDGQTPTLDEYVRRFPALTAGLRLLFANQTTLAETPKAKEHPLEQSIETTIVPKNKPTARTEPRMGDVIGTPLFIAMEWLGGEDLGERLSRGR
jgi:hypothetical protein